MISDALLDIAQCPECQGRIARRDDAVRCLGCGRTFATRGGVLDLRPLTAFAEQTKYLDEALHADARHEAIAPPLLGSRIRQDMLRRFLRPGPGDRIIDLGCGSGRTIVWNAGSGAALCGIDISPHFAPEAVAQSDLVLGDLRRLPLKSASFNKAWSLDVLEHVSPQAFRDVLTEAARVLEPGGGLFVYTHVRTNGWIAGGVRLVNRFARLCERAGLLDLRQERLRKSDHLNPIADHDELRRVVGECGFAIERITYYTPIVGAFVENVLVRMAERLLTRRAMRAQPAADAGATLKHVRSTAQARVRQGGVAYRGLRAVSTVMALDVRLFGRFRSGPYFALLRKLPAGSMPATRSSEAAGT
ncbi:MAG: methyltransferase domain-containing protein [Acidobacteria bacterium]|nr:methyltransferase domain-containing protein [Acidobacteriota bacterium]